MSHSGSSIFFFFLIDFKVNATTTLIFKERWRGRNLVLELSSCPKAEPWAGGGEASPAVCCLGLCSEPLRCTSHCCWREGRCNSSAASCCWSRSLVQHPDGCPFPLLTLILSLGKALQKWGALRGHPDKHQIGKECSRSWGVALRLTAALTQWLAKPHSCSKEATSSCYGKE